MLVEDRAVSQNWIEMLYKSARTCRQCRVDPRTIVPGRKEAGMREASFGCRHGGDLASIPKGSAHPVVRRA